METMRDDRKILLALRVGWKNKPHGIMSALMFGNNDESSSASLFSFIGEDLGFWLANILKKITLPNMDIYI